MKARHVILLVLLVLGCSRTTPRTATLTADEAGVLARRLANERAQTLFKCQPFRDGPPARLVQGRWVWRDCRGHGFVDIQAAIEFEADGARSKVDVILLDSRPIERF